MYLKLQMDGYKLVAWLRFNILERRLYIYIYLVYIIFSFNHIELYVFFT